MGIPPEEGGVTKTEQNTDVTLIVFNNCLYPNPPTKIEPIVVKATSPVEDVRKLIAEKLGYTASAFNITIGAKKVPLEQEEQPLTEWLKPGAKSLVHIHRNAGAKESDFGSDNKKVQHTSGKIAELKISPGSPNPSNSSVQPGAIVPYGPQTASSAAGAAGANWSVTSSSRSSYYSSGYTDWNKKSKCGFVGLSNQGATCYLNSLIQSLYMTPEFRYAVYKWDFEDTFKRRQEAEKLKLTQATQPTAMEIEKPNAKPTKEPTEEELKKQFEKDAIARQLQLLFARLQLRDQRAVKTKHLTSSFGWKDSDAFTQHDVQELCRVLFDALERVLKGTEQEHLINDLYQGEMKDYVKCKECEHDSSRTDKYLDIPLVIRGFGSTVPVKSVEEALGRFVQPEVLESDNQYKCEKCNKKVDAIKGLKFSSFPYLLTLQLKRFDFDYDTLRRIKLNDRVTFPLILDMNQFLAQDNMEGVKTELPVQPSKRKRSDEEGAEQKMDVDKENNNSNGKEEEDDTDFQTDMQNKLANGPYVYELYSVLIHRGSALGGHYYAYIKSFETNKWYEFNDSSVSEIPVEEIQKTFGEEADDKYRRPGMMYYHSSANAYMLMYRRIDAQKNKITVLEKEIPEQLRKSVDDEVKRRKEKQEEKEREREMVTVKIHYEMGEKTIKLHNKLTLADAVVKCADAFGVTSKYPPECIRLRNFQSYNEIPLEPFEGQILTKTLDDINWFSSKTVMLETRQPDEQFPAYNPSDMLLRVIRHNAEDNKFSESQPVYVHREATLGDLKKLLFTKFGIQPKFQRIIKENTGYGPDAKILEGDSKQLRSEHQIWEATKLYLEYCTDPESESPSFAEISRTKNMIEVKYNVPPKEEFDQTLCVSKKMTFKELKELLAPVVGITVDEFKVSRGMGHWRVEVKNESESLEENRLTDGAKLLIEKGRPLKEGETKMNFFFFDPLLKRNKEPFEDLFEMNVDETISMPALREIIAKRMKEDKNIEISPENLRIREVFSKSPSKVLRGNGTLKDAVNVLYNGKSLAIQELDGPEQAKGEDSLSLFIQQFFPSKYEVGPKLELILSENTPIPEFKRMLSTKYDIKNVGIAKAPGLWPGPDLLDVPNLDWDRQIPEYISSVQVGTLGTAPLYLRDGDILYFRDNDEPLKELSKDEKRKHEKEAQSKKRTTYYAKEEALTINAKV